MKHVFSNRGVCQAYVSNRCPDDHGSNSNSTLYFQGDTLFSYGDHYPLVHRIGRCYLINNDDCSATTSTHKREAIRCLDTSNMFSVSIVVASTQEHHRANYFDYKSRIEDTVGFWSRARTERMQRLHFETAHELYREAQEYLEQFIDWTKHEQISFRDKLAMPLHPLNRLRAVGALPT